jgi:tetratricopeptide (TPR) repeat protein
MIDEDIIRKVEDVASALRQARQRGDSASILMGAGMSVSAGVPLAQGFVEAVRSRDPAAYARAVEKTYPHVMGALEVGPRHDIIAEHVERARLNWAHILLGVLVQCGYIGRILTTNFDNLSLRCTGLYGVYPAVYDVTALAKFDASLIRDPAILFLHGQHRGFVQLHARADVTRNAKVLRPIFADATVRRPWLVLGYSGDNDPVFECLSRVKTFPYGLYWVGYREAPPSAAVADKLLGRTRQAFHVPGYDADTFMIALFRALELELPPLLKDPFTHSLDVLDQFAPFPTDHGGEDFTAPARSLCRNARRVLIEGGIPEPRSDVEVKLARLVMQGHLFRGEYDAVIAAGGEEVPAELRRLVAIALGVRAEGAHAQLRKVVHQFHDPTPLLTAALADLDRAIALAPGLAELHCDRGAVRWTALEAFTGETAEQLVALARADVAEALRRQPDLVVALYNEAYGEALVAQRADGEVRVDGLERALQGFRRILERDPEHVPSLVNTARVLFMLGPAGQPTGVAEGEALLGRAEQIDPRNHELRVLGLSHALSTFAEDWSELETRLPAFVARAETLLASDPDDVRGHFMFGLLQTIHAAFGDEPEARGRFDAGWGAYVAAREAPQWSRLARHIAVDELDTMMASLLSMEAGNRGEQAGADHYRRAEEILAAAALRPGQAAAALQQWGEMLSTRAKDAEDPLRTQLLDRADEKFAASLAEDPTDPETMLEWVAAKVVRIKANHETAADSHVAAIALLHRAEAVVPGATIHFAWAGVCEAFAETLTEALPRRIELLQEATARHERGLAEVDGESERWFDWAVCANGLAECFVEAGRAEEARCYYSTALSALDRGGEIEDIPGLMGQRADLLIEMAEFEEEQGDSGAANVYKQQAERTVEAALRREPEDRDILEFALDVYDQTGNAAAFAAHIRRLAGVEPPFRRSELTADDYELLERPTREIKEALALLPL